MKVEGTISKMSQALFLQSLHKIIGSMVRIKVYRDSYDFQSYCISELLTSGGWTELWKIPSPEMSACKQKINYIDTKCSACLYDDEKELVRISEQLLEGLP